MSEKCTEFIYCLNNLSILRLWVPTLQMACWFNSNVIDYIELQIFHPKMEVLSMLPWLFPPLIGYLTPIVIQVVLDIRNQSIFQNQNLKYISCCYISYVSSGNLTLLGFVGISSILKGLSIFFSYITYKTGKILYFFWDIDTVNLP